MIKIVRISTYPTDIYNKVGFHSFQLGQMDGFKTYFVSPNVGGCPFEQSIEDELMIFPFFLKTYPLDGNWFKKTIFTLRRIFSIILFSLKVIFYLSGKHISIIHIHSPMYLLIAIWGKIFRKKIFITFHGEDFNKVKNSSLYCYFSFLFNGVFAIAPSMLDRLAEIHGENVFLVGNGIEPDFLNTMKDRKKQILFVGSFKKVKGHKMMIAGFKLFLAKNSEFKLLFAGEGPLYDEIEKYVKKENLMDSVIFLGHKTKKELIELYNESLIFALNSFSEGFPKVVLEALACGCRVVSTKVGSVPNILGEDYPYFIEKHSPIGISKALNRAANRSEKYFKVYEKIPNKYTWNSVKELYREEYLKVFK